MINDEQLHRAYVAYWATLDQHRVEPKHMAAMRAALEAAQLQPIALTEDERGALVWAVDYSRGRIGGGEQMDNLLKSAREKLT